MKKIIPAKDFIVMTIPSRESAIALPDGVNVNREGFFVATAIGPDVKGIVVGDRIITIKEVIRSVKLDGKDYHLVKEEFVMGVIAEEADA